MSAIGRLDGQTMNAPIDAYTQLERRFRRLALVGQAAAVLHWDRATVMPPGGAAARSEQSAELALLRHEMIGDPALAELLDTAETAAADLDLWQAANLREMRRRWRRETAVPADLVAASVKANQASEMHWRQARPANDFAGQRPYLERVLALVREAAQARAEALGLAPYDALLDGYEAGLTGAAAEPILAELAAFLPPFLDRVLARQAELGPALPLTGSFPRAAQKRLGEQLMRTLGFDFEHGRLDESHHPFSGGVPDDVRITTRYEDDDFSSALLAVLHETGHALYAMHLPPAWRYQPVGEAMGMLVHESQSLIVEMRACRSDAFLAYLAPLLRDAFGVDSPAWAPENLARNFRRVSRDLIRVDASEVTYPLHVILRYRLEQAMLAGELAVGDLPGTWDDGMQALLGVRPPDLRRGCMQDIHWFSGAFGYFPTYTLGAVAAAQLFEAASRDADLESAVAEGDFRPLTRWLGEQVHGRGRLHENYDALLLEATGQPLHAAPFLAHLERRYGG